MAISAQDEARQVRNYLTSFFGRGDPRDQAMQVQRGHGFSASQSGGSTTWMDLWSELGHYNVHGHAGLAGNPRMHPDTMYEMNAADTAEAAYYNEDLDRRGLTINPRGTQWPGAMIAVDENNAQTFGRRSGQSYSMGPAIESNPGVSEAALPAQQRRRDELMAQMGATGPSQAVNQANSRSIIMDTTQSIGTPVRTVQAGVSVPPAQKDVKATVVSPGGFERTIKTPQSTREQLTSKLIDAGVEPTRVAEIVDKTRPFAKGPTLVPAPTQPTIVLTTSQSLGQKAAAIATREPVPVPRPQPAVGQAAILNGKPVVWNGSDWVKAPKPVVKPVVKQKVTVKPKPVVPATSTTRTRPTSASMQIRALQGSVGDVIKIHPGMSLPSSSLIQGI